MKLPRTTRSSTLMGTPPEIAKRHKALGLSIVCT